MKPQAAKQLVDSPVKTDAEGLNILNILVPNKETVEQMLNSLSKLFQTKHRREQNNKTRTIADGTDYMRNRLILLNKEGIVIDE